MSLVFLFFFSFKLFSFPFSPLSPPCILCSWFFFIFPPSIHLLLPLSLSPSFVLHPRGELLLQASLREQLLPATKVGRAALLQQRIRTRSLFGLRDPSAQSALLMQRFRNRLFKRYFRSRIQSDAQFSHHQTRPRPPRSAQRANANSRE